MTTIAEANATVAGLEPGVYLCAIRYEADSPLAGKLIGWEVISVAVPASPNDCAITWHGWAECYDYPRNLRDCTRRANVLAKSVAASRGLTFRGKLPATEQAARDARSR